MKQPRPLLALALVLPLLAGGTLVANAQPPYGGPDDGPLFGDGPGEGGHRGGPGGRDGRGGPGGPRGPRGGKGHLEGTWRGIQRLQTQEKSLSKAQAAKLVSLVKPWSNRASMSDADSEKLVQGMEAVLTTAQKSKVGPPRGGRGGPPRGGRGGPPRGGGDFGPPPPRDGDGGPPPPPDGDFGPPDGPGHGGDQGRGPGQGGPDGGRGPGRGGLGGPGGRMPFPQNFNPFYAPTGRSDWKNLPASTQQFLARRYRDNRAVLESLSRFAKS